MIKLLSPEYWNKKGLISYLLLPLSFVYRFVVWLRRIYYKFMVRSKLSVPVIVIGNITVGGAGKTPLVIYLVNLLRAQGYNPGVVTRGYGRKSKKRLMLVDSDSKPEDIGDEPLLIFRRTNCPIVVDSDRVAAAKKLIAKHGCDLIISDDGLQHYKLPRHIEIAVVDANFKFGNGFCLPAGPLREPISRLKSVDFVVQVSSLELLMGSDPLYRDLNPFNMVLEATSIRNVKNPQTIKEAVNFEGKEIHAVAGIARPSKFFQTLRELNLNFIEHAFPDHHLFKYGDFPFADKTIIMTEKDAVKCDKIANDNFWYVKADAKLDKDFDKSLLGKLKVGSRGL